MMVFPVNRDGVTAAAMPSSREAILAQLFFSVDVAVTPDFIPFLHGAVQESHRRVAAHVEFERRLETNFNYTF